MVLAKPKLAEISQKPAKIEAVKLSLHPRNKHRQRYDFDALIKTSPALAPFVAINSYGDCSIDFANPKAVLSLNTALLHHFYNIKNWQIPSNYLCPPIPSRTDYVHNLADLLAVANRGIIPKTSNIHVLDIGVGANMIYPLIGYREYGWRFVGVDCDTIALNNAQQIIHTNMGLADNITLRLQSNSANIFKGIIKPNDFFDITICNPPFHASLADAQAGTQRKWQQLAQGRSLHNKFETSTLSSHALNFGGQGAELYSTGGEKAFINSMVNESAQFATQCFWFTTLVSALANLPGFYKALKKVDAFTG